MEQAKTFTIRPGVLPPLWPRFLTSGSPTVRAPGAVGQLHRDIVSSAFRSSIVKAVPSRKELHPDEMYACASTLWRDAVRALQYVRDLRGPSAKAELMARKLFGCSLVGYHTGNPERVSCKLPMCLYCYARRVGYLYTDMVRAYRRCPDGTPIYMSPFYLVEKKKLLLARLRKIRPACAAFFLHPYDNKEDYKSKDPLWDVRGVMMTDDIKKIRERKYHRKVDTEVQIVRAITNWFPYPREWGGRFVLPALSRTIKLFAGVPRGVQLYTTLGACREDYVPGKGWLDFVVNDKVQAG